MNIEAIRNTYRRYASSYDTWFGPVLHPGRKLVVQSLQCQPGERILEVGVGTGLSLPLYPGYARVVGIDISREMLSRARQRIGRLGLAQVEAVVEMDAENMQFADNSFDKVVAMYVVSVIPDPARLVDEMRRVCRPGGDIFIVNHFRSANPLLAALESAAAPLSKLAGFRPDLDLGEFLRGSALDVIERKKTNMFGYWRMLRCRNDKQKRRVARPDAGHATPTD